MSDLNEWLKERRTIHNAATEGPWGIGSWRDRSFQHHMTIEPEQGHRTIGDVTDDHRGNATAIVDAHSTLPAMLTAVENVLEAIAQIDREYSKAPGENAYADGMCDAAYMFDKALSEAIEGAIK